MYYGWLIVFLVALYQGLMSGLINYSYGILIVPIVEELGASLFVAMLGLTAAKLVSGVASPVLGAMIDKHPMRIFVTLGIVALGSTFILLSYLSAVWQFPVIFGLLVSIVFAFLGPLTGSTLVSRWFSRRRGRALGFAALGLSIGGFVAPPALQYFMDSLGWRGAFFAIGSSILVTAPVFYWLIKNSPQEIGLLPDGEPLATTSEAQQKQIEVDPYNNSRAILVEPAFWMLGISTGILYASLTAVLASVAPYAVDLGVDKQKAAQLISIMAFTGILGKLMFGYAADFMNLKVGYWLAMAFMGAGLLLLSIQPAYQLMVVASVVIGLSIGGLIPIYGALLAKVFGIASYARVMGLMRIVTLMISMIGAPFAGLIFDMTGSFTLAFQAFSVALVVAGLVIIPLKLSPKLAVSG
jgi:sugar phosphate permease